jgi:hypothetical protein
MIAQSVGNRGVNNVDDVLIIQSALNAFRLRNGQGAIAVDGLVGNETTGAITEFQRQHRLPADGRIDEGGVTLPRLTDLIGGAEGVFGPMIAQLLPLVEALREVARTAPPRVREPITRMAGGYERLNQFRDLTTGLNGGRAPLGFAAGPRVFGFAGADDVAAAATLGAMVVIMAIFFVLMIQSPAFRREVSIRAKELDRIMKGLQINANTGLKDAIDLLIAVANGTIEEQNRCRQSPTFLPSGECAEAFREFSAIVARLNVQVAALFQLLLQLTTQRSSFTNLQALRVRFNALMAAAQQEAINLQVSLANMREVCKYGGGGAISSSASLSQRVVCSLAFQRSMAARVRSFARAARAWSGWLSFQ